MFDKIFLRISTYFVDKFLEFSMILSDLLYLTITLKRNIKIKLSPIYDPYVGEVPLAAFIYPVFLPGPYSLLGGQ